MPCNQSNKHRYLYGFIVLLITLASSFSQAASQQYRTQEHKNSAVIFVYHHVSSETPAITSVSPERFEEQLAHIEKSGFSVWPLEKLIKAFQDNKKIPDKVTVITFDDAYDSVYSEAYPRLKKRQWPFTIFVSSDSVDKGFNHQLSWDKLREMTKHGASIANHTVNHSHLPRYLKEETDQQWQARMKSEINVAQQRIKKEIGTDHTLFAYPYGEHNKALKKIVAELGYVAFGQQSGAIGELIDFQIIPRFPVSGIYTEMKDFALKLNTLALPAKEIDASDNPILANDAKPYVKLAFKQKIHQAFFQCYGSSGELPVSWEGNIATVTSKQAIPAGRSRYNCTLPAGEGRFYWYSKPWVRLKENGEWILD